MLTEIRSYGEGLIIADQSPGKLADDVVRNTNLQIVHQLRDSTDREAMANAMEQLRSGDPARSSRWITAATLAGVLFMGLKGAEYTGTLRQGYDLHHNTFFTLYWLLTGFHFLHVLVATVLLAAMGLGVHQGKYTATKHDDVGSSGIFWHMCDLIWLLLMLVG